MSSSAMFGMKSHEPLRRLSQQESFSTLPSELVCEDTPCIMPLSRENGFVLPTNYVSVPSKEEGYIALRQQIAKGMEVTDQQEPGAKNWHHKAIRRNISKAKELVLFVGGLKCNLPASQYVTYATRCAKTEKSSVGPVFPSLGCFFITFFSGKSASNAWKLFRLTRFIDAFPELLLLPYINMPTNTQPANYDPLLVFINYKSGGGQGSQLFELMEEILNPYQLFLIEKVGALPGLYAFRKLPRFRVLICGGDGTVGWVISHLEVVQRHLQCSSPPIAVLPVGTGNDLARVLGFGSGWSGENINGILAQVEDSQPVQLDRWNIMFDSSVPEKRRSTHTLLSNAVSLQNHPLSPVNIVMNVGGLNAYKKNYLPEDDKDKEAPTLDSPVDSNDACTSIEEEIEPTCLRDTSQDLEPVTGDVIDDGSDDVAVSVTDDVSSALHNAVGDTNEQSKVADDINGVSDDVTSGLDNVEDEVVAVQVTDTEASLVVEESNTDNLSTKNSETAESVEFNAEDSLEGDALERSASGSISRHKKSKLSAKHRLVHIVSESDMEFGPFVGYEDSDVEKEELESWKEKISLLRLNDDDKSVESADSSSSSTDVRDNPIKNVSVKEVRDNTETAESYPNDLAGSHITYSQQAYRHHSAANLLEHKNKQEFQKKLSLPVTYTFKPEIEPQETANEVKMQVMSNYFGMGIGAELTLAFHLAREGNPEKCTSRLRNKALYFKAGLKKMTTPSVNLNTVIDLEVDNVKIVLPSIRGLVFLNISSWGAGSHPWGSRVSKRFDPPSFGDGKLEVVGVGGVAHMSQIYSGLRTGIRIAQGEFIKISLSSEVAMQIDGEPWLQPPGKIIITASTLQATMLKRNKKKSK